MAAITLKDGDLELALDGVTGAWLELRDGPEALLRAGDLLSPLLLTIGGHTMATRGWGQMFTLADTRTVGLDWALERLEAGRREALVELREGDWRAQIRYSLQDGRVTRALRLTFIGEGEALLRCFALRMPAAWLGPAPECCVEAPGHPVRPGQRLAWLGYGKWGQLLQGAFQDAPAWRPPIIGLHNPGRNLALSFWCQTETEPFFPALDRTDQGALVSHCVYLAGRLASGQSLEWGAQYLEVNHMTWLEALRKFQDFYREVGWRVPEPVPDWMKSINLYEVHVGTLTGTKLAPFPTYAELLDELPRIRDKGYEVVYIMPHVPFPSYSVIDYMDWEAHHGSEEGFRAFVTRAHELGLKVMVDVTLHGVMDHEARRRMAELDGTATTSYPLDDTVPERHPYIQEHPDWFSRNEYGEIATTYTHAFDHADPSWQEFMVQVFLKYVEELDVDGFRVDSHTWNFFPNWAEGLDRPGSHSFYGSSRMLEKVREAVRRVKPEVVFYTETAGPLFHKTHELAYNYDETWMVVSSIPMKSRRGVLCHSLQAGHLSGPRISAHDIALWLEQRRLALPEGAIKVHHLDCHDTYWRPKEFRRETFGPDAARAVVALFAFIDGGFMDYHGADEGLEDFYRRVVWLRRCEPALRHGSCDYLAVHPSSDMVMAPLREAPGEWMLPIINLDNRPHDVELSVPAGRLFAPGGAFRLQDALMGEPAEAEIELDEAGSWIARIRLHMGPYGVVALKPT